MAEKVVCKNPEFLCNRVVLADLNAKGIGQAVAGDEDGCSSNTRAMIFAPTAGDEDIKIEQLKKELKRKLGELGGSGEQADSEAVVATSEDRNYVKIEKVAAMPNPLCNRPFRVKKFIVLEIPNVGRGAIGREENGCSSHTRPMLIEPEGNDAAQKQANFDKLRKDLEQALAAAAKPAKRP